MTTAAKFLANCIAVLAVLGIVYAANPTFKAFADTKYAEWSERREIERLEQLEENGAIIILDLEKL